MPEEFIDDINAAADKAEAAKAADAAADTTKATADATATDDVADVAAVAAADTDNSSSATDAADLKKDTDAADSGDLDVAPAKPSEVEELASKLGWNKDHKGAEAVDAATYILRSKDIQKTMKDHNKDLKGQLTGLQGSVEALKDHNERVYQADVKKLKHELAGLKKEKKAAVELADVAKVEELDQQIDEVQKDIDAPVKEEVAPANPEYANWVADNGWYLTDPEMATYADAVADQYQGAPAARIYAIVRQKVAEVFPDKFAADNADGVTATDDADVTAAQKIVDDAQKVIDDAAAAKKVTGPKSPVEKGTRTTEEGSFTKADLSSAQVAIMNQFVKGGIMTEDQYIADIAKMQEA